MIPPVQTIEGQGGNIQYAIPVNGTLTAMNIQVRKWQIRKTFLNADVTTTGSGGWEAHKRVLARWEFTAEWPYDATAARMGSYDGVQLINGVWVRIGLEYPIAASCLFQIGASGAVTNQSIAPTVYMQYQGTALISSDGVANPATDIVQFTVSGIGNGALVGPVAGQIS